MNLKWTVPLGAAVLILFGSGCASVMNRRAHAETKPFPGVRRDAYLLMHPKSVGELPLHPVDVLTFSLVDMPWSAAVDALLLPMDLTKHKPEVEESKGPPEPKR
jgi:uncharacterized protein YceK